MGAGAGAGEEAVGLAVGGATTVDSGGTGDGGTRLAAAFAVAAWSVDSSTGNGIDGSSR